jgi:hypothetical protein
LSFPIITRSSSLVVLTVAAAVVVVGVAVRASALVVAVEVDNEEGPEKEGGWSGERKEDR